MIRRTLLPVANWVQKQKSILLSRKHRITIESVFVVTLFTLGGILLLHGEAWLIPLVLPPEYSKSLNYMAWLSGTLLVGILGPFGEIYFLTKQNEKNQ